MIGSNTANTVQGALFIRATSSDYSTFAGGITEAEFETAFPAATAQHGNASGGVEITEAAANGYQDASGNTINNYSDTPIPLVLSGISETEYDSIITNFQNVQVDVAIKRSVCGANSLGDGYVFRDFNFHIGRGITINGNVVYPVTLQKIYPAKISNQVVQKFDIAAT